ncbi:MAG: glutamate decarboxylase [Firmicutes bacterium]|nr:glutamate decarboxylase [Bacillota bacterium]
MWKVVFIARTKSMAEKLQEQLQNEGLLVMLRPLGGGELNSQYEILVPESEVDEAQEVLTSV